MTAHFATPFRAAFGKHPPILVGREDAIGDFALALDEGPGANERVSMLIGPRGIGKTVLLSAFEDEARQRGWRVFSETARPGFIERLRHKIAHELRVHRAQLSGLNLTIMSIGLGLEWEKLPEEPLYTLRDALDDLFEAQAELDRQAKQAPTGVLITVDEMHYQRSADIVELGATIQHLIREDRNIAAALAGIPSAVYPLLDDNELDGNPIAFLRRANKISLGAVNASDVEEALRLPAEEAGFSWDSEALALAQSACQGYPFMIQLVGQWTIRELRKAAQTDIINESIAEAGIRRAQESLGQLVHEPVIRELSDADRSVLVAMAEDDGPSLVSDLAQRLGKSDQFVSNYRRRLLDAEVIAQPSRGKVDFVLPYLREYVREHQDKWT